jgi:DUF4097 and DUF4098 domain-containing protein YvlB
MKLACSRGLVILCATLWLIPTAASGTPRGGEQRETEVVDRSFPLNPDGQLRLRNFSGKVVITGSNRTDVAVHAVRRAPREQLSRIHLDIDASASTITIEANRKEDNGDRHHSDVVETDFEIEVPQRASVDVDVFSSDVHITGVEGKQRVHTFSGEIRVDAAVGPLDAETFSGDIEVDLASTASGRLDFDSFSGSLDTDKPMTYRTGNKRHVSGDIGNAGGSNAFHFKTFSGDVRIK